MVQALTDDICGGSESAVHALEHEHSVIEALASGMMQSRSSVQMCTTWHAGATVCAQARHMPQASQASDLDL